MPFATALAVLAIVAAAPAASPSLTSARGTERQAPGFYRSRLGAFEVVALLDGTHGFAAEPLAVGAKPGEVRVRLQRQHLASPFEGMINAFLVRTPERLVLVDTGAGDLYGKDGGLLVGNLRAAGFTPDQVDEIYLTHLHRDHVGGLMLSGRAVFPRAIVRAPRADADYWLNNANRKAAPAILQPMFDGAQQVLRPYIASGRFQTFRDGAVLTPGIRPIAAPGHTPGHTRYVVESAGQTLVIWGDTVHMAAVQFADPKVGIRYDSDVRQAIRSRERVFSEAADHGWWVAGAHISFPGIGHVDRVGRGAYAWTPANYSLNRVSP